MRLREFAPDSDGGDRDWSDEQLKQFAAEWRAGNENRRIEQLLRATGWDIGWAEGYIENEEDEPGVFVMASDETEDKTYQDWPPDELEQLVPTKNQGVAEGLTNFDSLSDAELIRLAHRGYISGNLEYNEDGALVNRDEIIRLLKTTDDAGEDYDDEQGMAEGSLEDPFGPQGRFVGDTGPAQITTTVVRVQLKPGDKVLYKPTEQRARIEAMSQDGTKARIHVPSPMGGRTFNCEVTDLKAIGRGSLEEKSTSQAQFRTMAAAAHDPKFARKVGIKPSVAKEFNRADTGQDYKSLPKRAD